MNTVHFLSKSSVVPFSTALYLASTKLITPTLYRNSDTSELLTELSLSEQHDLRNDFSAAEHFIHEYPLLYTLPQCRQASDHLFSEYYARIFSDITTSNQLKFQIFVELTQEVLDSSPEIQLHFSAESRTRVYSILQTVFFQTQTTQLFDLLGQLIYHDLPTFNHSIAVMWLMSLLLQAFPSLSKKERASGLLSAVFHDIGKLYLSPFLLNKPGALTAAERFKIQEHSRFGAKILKKVFGTSDSNLLEYVHTHHERYDGTGYPLCQAGTAIALPSRLLSVADVFDALLTTRSYREAMTFTEAFTEMRTAMSGAFDPKILNILHEYFSSLIDTSFITSSTDFLYGDVYATK
jgi:HD-GYP domain-containing protein (c-di-GMP phosphodiesterase class II)